MMRRVVVIGSPGSGKTTLSGELGMLLSIPVCHLDGLLWRDGWTTVSREEFDRQLHDVLSGERWIIDGNFDRTMKERIDACDTVIYLDMPRFLCLFSVIRRTLCSLGKSRSEMGGDCPERFDKEFLAFVWKFNGTYRKKYHSMLEGLTGKQVHILTSRRQVARFLLSLQKNENRIDNI